MKISDESPGAKSIGYSRATLFLNLFNMKRHQSTGTWRNKHYLHGKNGMELRVLVRQDYVQDQAEGDQAPGTLPTPTGKLAHEA
jgi:hypothetical protein